MKIFIIGSNSFMGSSLINYISKNHNIEFELRGCSRSVEKKKILIYIKILKIITLNIIELI